MRAIKRHGSRVGWQIAPMYTRYLKKCREKFSGILLSSSGVVIGAVESFRLDGITSFHTPETEIVANLVYERIRRRENNGENLWGTIGSSGNQNYNGCAYRDFPELERLFKGAIGEFLQNYYGTHFKIFYASMFKSVNLGGGPKGSQLWHSDSGPGTCVIVAFYLHDVLDDGAGPLHVLPWRQSVEVFENEFEAVSSFAKRAGINLRKLSGESRRELIVKYYGEAIRDKYSSCILAPKGRAGLVVPFLNNAIHFGGYPAPGRERIAVLFHCYPSDIPPDFQRYLNEGLGKIRPYPINPAE